MKRKPVQGVAAQVLRSLPSDGEQIRGSLLRKKLGLTEKKFQAAADELLQNGYIENVKGRTGSLRLIETPAQVIELPAGMEELKSLARLTSLEARNENTERKNRAGTPDEDFEDRTWRLIYDLKPSYISIGRKPPIKLSSGTICPDVFALFSSHTLHAALIVECKFSAEGQYPSAYLADWISKLRQHRNELRRLVIEKIKLEKLLIIAAVNDVSEIPQRLKTEAGQLKVRWLDSTQVDYFQKVYDESGVGINHLFWSTIAPETVYLKEKCVPAMKTRAGHGAEVYLFSINAHELLGRAYVSHRELQGMQDHTTYQRMFKKTKLNAIKEYIDKYSTFPTPIVVSFDQKCGQVFEKDPGKAEVQDVVTGRVRLPARARSIQVIDGQHRLYGYSLVAPDPSHIIHVVAYAASKDLDAAKLFVDINAKQTPVPTSLLWELYPDIYSKEDPEYFKAMISNAVEDQIKNHLMNRVKHITLHSDGQITFQTLCKEVQRLKLISRRGGLLAVEIANEEARQRKLSDILDAFFTVLKSFDKDYPEVSESVIFTNVGLVPMIRICGRILTYENFLGKGGMFQSKTTLVSTLTDYFTPIYKYYHQKPPEDLRQMLSGKSSEGGFNLLDDELTKVIQEKYKSKFPPRQTLASAELERAVDDVARTMDEINKLALRSAPGHWIFNEFDSHSFSRKLKKREFDEDSFHTAIRVLHQELVEGTQSEPGNNSFLDLLRVSRIDQVPALEELNLVRNYSSHKKLRDNEKMLRALQSLRRLTGRNDFFDLGELNPSQLESALVKLLNDLNANTLSVALANLKQRAAKA